MRPPRTFPGERLLSGLVVLGSALVWLALLAGIIGVIVGAVSRTSDPWSLRLVISGFFAGLLLLVAALGVVMGSIWWDRD
jgi:uncharacterized membrane protein